MKTYHYYYAPYFGTYNGAKFCHFFMTCWEQGNRSLKPDGVFWKPVFVPRPHNMLGKYFTMDDHIFSTMMMYRFFYNTVCSPDEMVIKVHDAKSQDKRSPETLSEMMNLLTHIFEFDEGHMKAYSFGSKSRAFAMTPELQRLEGYRAIKFVTEEEFQFLLNILYDVHLPQKILEMNDPNSQSNIWVKYANTVTNNHRERSEYTWRAAEERLKRYYYKADPVPYSFTSFMKNDLIF